MFHWNVFYNPSCIFVLLCAFNFLVTFQNVCQDSLWISRVSRYNQKRKKNAIFKDTQCLALCIFQHHVNLAVQNIHLEYHVQLLTNCGTSEPSLCLLHSLNICFSKSYVFALHTQVCISIFLFSKTCIKHVMN